MTPTERYAESDTMKTYDRAKRGSKTMHRRSASDEIAPAAARSKRGTRGIWLGLFIVAAVSCALPAARAQ
jgi:hypothetical protein